jgi:ferritin
MLSKKLHEAILDQITFEYFSSHVYLAMAAYCHRIDLDGFANFYKIQAEEERFHAMKFFIFLNEMDADIDIRGFENPSNDYKSIVDVFEHSLAHEKIVTSRIYNLMDIAQNDKEHATISFLKWFIDEQVEEEANFKGFLQKLKRSASEHAVLYNMDDELLTRVYTEPQ